MWGSRKTSWDGPANLLSFSLFCLTFELNQFQELIRNWSAPVFPIFRFTRTWMDIRPQCIISIIQNRHLTLVLTISSSLTPSQRAAQGEALNLRGIMFAKENCFLNGLIPASFCLFSSFSHYNFNNTNWKSLDGVLGIWTHGRKMVGADETIEL